jgi:glucuronokinase
MKFYQVKIPNEILPNIILSAEVDELGINAGLQDRVIQVYEGCVHMNFDKSIIEEKGHGIYTSLKPSLLPRLYIAYKTELGKVSGKVLNDIRTRYEQGEKETIDTLNRIAQIADDGSEAICDQDVNKLDNLINENFDLRCKIMNVSDSNKEMVRVARECGASAKFTGSGGSIIGIYKDDDMLNHLIIELKKIKARVIKPYIV